MQLTINACMDPNDNTLELNQIECVAMGLHLRLLKATLGVWKSTVEVE